MQITRVDGKSGILGITLYLKRGCGADGGIESEVTSLAVSWTGLNVTPSLAIGAGEAPLSGLASGQLIERGLQALGTEIGADGCRAFRYLVVIVGGLVALVLGR